MVCTGNACRSPMAAAILRQRLAERGVDARVMSAGTLPWNAGATDTAVEVMHEHGLDIAGHENRQVTRELLEEADLVLGMTRDHVSIATARNPRVRGRTFLVGELARLGAGIGPRAASEPVALWAERAAAARPLRRPLGRAVDVIDAAMKLAAEGGYDAVQMRDVAREAGVALGTIYRYFASKDHLLAACQVEFAREEQRQLERRPTRGDTAADRVVDVLRRATRSQERQPLLTAAMVTAISSPDPAVSGCQRDVTAVMAAVLAEPMRDGDPKLRPGIVRALSHVWFSALLGWVNGWTNVGAVGEELESAARLLLRDV